MAIKPIEGFYVHDEETGTDGVAKVSVDAVHEFVEDVSGAVDSWLENNPDIWSPIPDDSLTTEKYKDGSVTGEKLSEGLQEIVIDNVHEKPLLYGEGNTACLTVNSNYPNVDAGVAASDIVMQANNFTTSWDGTYYAGKFQNVTATTANTVTVEEDLSGYAIPGMWVWLYTTLPQLGRNHSYFGVITSVNGNTLAVNEWRTHSGSGYDRPTSGTVATPSDVLYAVVNPVNKLYANHGYYRLLDPNEPSGARWTGELIGYQAELYTDVPGATIYGYDVVIRQNTNDADAYAFRARTGSGHHGFTKVLHVDGDADMILSHNSVSILGGDGRWFLPYVHFGSMSTTPAPVMLTNGNTFNLSTIAENATANAKFTLINNSGTRTTVTVNSGHTIRFGGSSKTVTSFNMDAQEALDVIIPNGGSNFWVYGVKEFCPGDKYYLPTNWYIIAMNQSAQNTVVIPLPYGHRTCNGVTVTGKAGIRINGSAVTDVKEITDTSVYDSVTATLGDGVIVLNFDLVDSTVRNAAGIVYLQNIVFTFT